MAFGGDKPTLAKQLEDWLSASRSRRITVIPNSLSSPEAGTAGVIELKMAAGKRADLEYMRGLKDPPSSSSTFKVSVICVAGARKSSWEGKVTKTLDDVGGTARFKVPWGPVQVAGEHLIHISLGGKLLTGTPCRARVRPSARTSAATSSLHPDEAPPPSHLPPQAPLASAPTAQTLEACARGAFCVVARDAYGNRRESGGDKPFAVVRRVGDLSPTGSSSSASAPASEVEPAEATTSAGADGGGDEAAAAEDAFELDVSSDSMRVSDLGAVSYTHLTLPTICSV